MRDCVATKRIYIELTASRFVAHDDDTQDMQQEAILSRRECPNAPGEDTTAGSLYHRLPNQAGLEASWQRSRYAEYLGLGALARRGSDATERFPYLFGALRSLSNSSFSSALPILTLFLDPTSASPIEESSKSQDNSREGQDTFGFNLFWYIALLLVALGYTALSYHHRDKWSFLGLGMGVSTWSYLVMVLVGGVPLDVIVR